MNNSFEALLDENLYFPDMEKIDSDICSKVMTHFDSYNPTSYSAEDVKKALAKEGPAVIINAWNEWTEGMALLPDTQYGTGYLDTIAKITTEMEK